MYMNVIIHHALFIWYGGEESMIELVRVRRLGYDTWHILDMENDVAVRGIDLTEDEMKELSKKFKEAGF